MNIEEMNAIIAEHFFLGLEVTGAEKQKNHLRKLLAERTTSLSMLELPPPVVFYSCIHCQCRNTRLLGRAA